MIISIKIFITMSASVSEGERTFCASNYVKNDNRSTMTQERLNSIAILNINYEIARNLNFRHVFADFANKKARKAFLK